MRKSLLASAGLAFLISAAYLRSLGQNPHVGPRYSSGNPRLRNLRSWPVVGFEAIRIYYSLEADAIDVIRILPSKRDVRRILENE